MIDDALATRYNHTTARAMVRGILCLQKELTDEKDTVEHLRKKAEFDMPVSMHGRFHNGQCPDACDMVDGPCACGAWHSAKEWIGKLNTKLVKAEEVIETKDIIIKQLNRRLRDIGAQC
jgi:hypothetical protein